MTKATKPKPRAKAKPKAAPRPRGRPSKFTSALADEVCKRLSTGETLQSICREDHMPDVRTVNRWTEAAAGLPQFASDFARARAAGHDAIAAETLDIADDGRNDWMKRHGEEDAGWQANGEHVQRSKLRVWTRLQLLAKWDPKRYGERQTLVGDPDAPLQVVDYSSTSAETLRALAALKLRDAGR